MSDPILLTQNRAVAHRKSGKGYNLPTRAWVISQVCSVARALWRQPSKGCLTWWRSLTTRVVGGYHLNNFSYAHIVGGDIKMVINPDGVERRSLARYEIGETKETQGTMGTRQTKVERELKETFKVIEWRGSPLLPWRGFRNTKT